MHLRKELDDLKQKKFNFDHLLGEIRKEEDRYKGLSLEITQAKEHWKGKLEGDQKEQKSLRSELGYLMEAKTEHEGNMQLMKEQKTSLSKYLEDEESHI